MKKAHTHLADIAHALDHAGDQVACQHIVLKHFSMKYPKEQVLELVAAGIPERFRDRIRMWGTDNPWIVFGLGNKVSPRARCKEVLKP